MANQKAKGIELNQIPWEESDHDGSCWIWPHPDSIDGLGFNKKKINIHDGIKELERRIENGTDYANTSNRRKKSPKA